MSTDYTTTTALGFLIELEGGVSVREAPIEPRQCEWCADPDAITRARVYAPDATPEVCPECVRDVIQIAKDRTPEGDDRDIIVEVQR